MTQSWLRSLADLWCGCRVQRIVLMTLFVIGFSQPATAKMCEIEKQTAEQRLSSLPLQEFPASKAQEPSIPTRIEGIITLSDQSVLAGATVTLMELDETPVVASTSDALGRFVLESISSGRFFLKVSRLGFESFTSPEFKLLPGEACDFPAIELNLHVDEEIDIVATHDEVAKEEVKALERQRVLGILPNFYTSYVAHPVALSVRQKYDLAFHAVGDPGTFLSAAAVAGIEQAENMFPGYGQGAQGYAKRFGAATADSVISRMLGSAVLPGALHQDPRYFYKGSGTGRSRLFYALSMTVICKGDDGRMEPNYSHIGGSLASGALSNLYHARTDRGIGLTMVQALLDFTGRASNNLIQEFLLKRVTTNTPLSHKP